MSLPDELKTQILDASVGGIEAFLTCVGCCVVALHPKGRHDKAMKEYCLSSEFYERFIDQWGRRWSRLPSRSRKSSHSPQPHVPAPSATTPMKSRHKKNNSSGGVQFLPSPQSPGSDMVSGPSTPRPPAGDDSLFENRVEASTSPSPSPANAPSTQKFSIDPLEQPTTEGEWNTFLNFLLDPLQEDTSGFPEPSFTSNSTYPSISTSAVPDGPSKALPVRFEEGVTPRVLSKTIGQEIIRPFSNSIAEQFLGGAQIIHEQQQTGPPPREQKRGTVQNQVVLHDSRPIWSQVDEIPTIKVVTPNGTLSSPVIDSFEGVAQRLSELAPSQSTGQNSGIQSNDRVLEGQGRRPCVLRAPSVPLPPSIHGKRERKDPRETTQHDVRKRRRLV